MRKESDQRILDAFPDEADLAMLAERLGLFEKIEAGEQQIAAGHTVSHEDAAWRLRGWLA